MRANQMRGISRSFMRPSQLLLVVFFLITFSYPGFASDDTVVISKRTAVAQQAFEYTKDGKPAKVDFDFGDFTAWARRDGSWNAEGMVHHNGLLCGTYTLSLRLGQGNPGCINVKWFGEPGAVGKVTLCNNADGKLTGGNTEFVDTARFDEITCAERVITCSGTCK